MKLLYHPQTGAAIMNVNLLHIKRFSPIQVNLSFFLQEIKLRKALTPLKGGVLQRIPVYFTFAGVRALSSKRAF